MTKSQLVPFWALFSLSRGLNITKSDYTTDGIPCISYGDVHGRYRGFVDASTDPLPKVPESFFKSDPKSLLKDGDFVFADTSEDYDGAGDCTCILNSGVNLFAGYHITIARPRHPEQIDKDYFGFYFQTNQFKNQVRLQVNGVKVFSVTNKILNATRLYVPERENQKNIGSKLKRKVKQIDEALSCLNELREKQEKLSQSLITHAVTKGRNPDVQLQDYGLPLWSLCTCNDDVLSENTSPDLIVKYADISNVTSKNGVEGYTVYHFANAPSRARRLVRPGDIVISTVRTYLKAIALIGQEHSDFVFSTGFAVIRPKNVEDAEKIFLALKSSLFIDQVNKASKGVAYPAITASDLMHLKVIIPDDLDNLRVKLNLIRELVVQLQQQKDKLNSYRNSLIDRSISSAEVGYEN